MIVRDDWLVSFAILTRPGHIGASAGLGVDDAAGGVR